jgi:NAD-dependent SIR2 family protein deacetylase
MMTDTLSEALKRAAEAILNAEALLLCAGAGMGVDSGLPDFRGTEGFWRAYPPFAKLNLRFEELACPVWFKQNPALAWGFYGHRLHLYRDTIPHEGYTLLRQWAESKPQGYFVFTSNVDGHFAKAGFDPDRIVECHGSLHHLQCSVPCHHRVWEAIDLNLTIDEATMHASLPFPTCPRCRRVARPNVMMFDDGDWVSRRTDAQEQILENWLDQQRQNGTRITIIECGAGRAIPSVRWFSDFQTMGHRARLIRINPRDANVPEGGIALPMGAKEALTQIETLLNGSL